MTIDVRDPSPIFDIVEGGYAAPGNLAAIARRRERRDAMVTP
jgi:hypothetical protein